MRPILLLINLAFFDSSSFGQTLCNPNQLFSAVEHPPQLVISVADLELQLNNTIDGISLNYYHADYLYVTCYINCNGNDFNYKLAKLSDGMTKIDSTSEFQKKFLSNLQSLASWTPGRFTSYEKGKPVEKIVDVFGSLTIRVNGNKLHILSEKEALKHFKSEKK